MSALLEPRRPKRVGDCRPPYDDDQQLYELHRRPARMAYARYPAAAGAAPVVRTLTTTPTEVWAGNCDGTGPPSRCRRAPIHFTNPAEIASPTRSFEAGKRIQHLARADDDRKLNVCADDGRTSPTPPPCRVIGKGRGPDLRRHRSCTFSGRSLVTALRPVGRRLSRRLAAAE